MRIKRLLPFLMLVSSLVVLTGCIGDGVDWKEAAGERWRNALFVGGSIESWRSTLLWFLGIASLCILWRVKKGLTHDLKQELILGIFTREAYYNLLLMFWIWLFPLISSALGNRVWGDLGLEQAWENMHVTPEFSIDSAITSWSTAFIFLIAFFIGGWQRLLIAANIMLGLSALYSSPLRLWKSSLVYFIGWFVYVYYIYYELGVYGPELLGEDPTITNIIGQNASFLLYASFLGPVLLIVAPSVIAFLIPSPDDYELTHHEEWRVPHRIERKVEVEVNRRWEISDEMRTVIGATAGAIIGGMMSGSGSSEPPHMPPSSPEYPNGFGRNGGGGPSPSPSYGGRVPGIPARLPSPVDEEDDAIEGEFERVESPESPNAEDKSTDDRAIPMGLPKRETRRPSQEEQDGVLF